MTNIGGELSCKCGTRRSSSVSVFDSKSTAPSTSNSNNKSEALIDNEDVTRKLDNILLLGDCPVGGTRGSPTPDLLGASYFDVAVLRCLFCPEWAEEGVFWALTYLHQRLLEVTLTLSKISHFL